MLNLGLTGGIGSGKSAVSAVLHEIGATIVDADKVAREVVEPGTEGLRLIRATFGDAVLTAEGALDRPALAKIVFNDDDARLQLNAIVHPLVRARSEQIVRSAGEKAIIVHDIPLLAEGTTAPSFHLVLIVVAPEAVRLERLTTSRGMDRDDALARIEAQATDEQRLAIADIVLDNGGSPQELRSQIERQWRERLAPYGQALAEQAPARARVTPREGAVGREQARLTWALADLDVTAVVTRDQDVVVTGEREAVGPALERAGWFGTQKLRPADPGGILTVRLEEPRVGPVLK